MARGVTDHAKRKQWNAVLGAGARDELRLHIHSYGGRRLRNSVSFLAGIDHGWDSQKIGDMDREMCERIERQAQVSSREISRKQKIADTQLIVNCSCKSGGE